nr:hypothetical protein 5 [Candidatus Aminicenantes bacterium]
MSYGLSIGGTPVIEEAQDTFNSFWLGYSFQVLTGNENEANIKVDKAFLAVYCSYETSKKVPILGKKHYENVSNLDSIEISGKGKKIKMKNLEYKGMQSIEAANQSMELHLFQFHHENEREKIKEWVDDSSWFSGFRLEGKEKSDGKAPLKTWDGNPFWTRYCDWGQGERYCHSTVVRRDSNGLQTLAFSMPYQQKSLFQEWLKNDGKVKFPPIQVKSKQIDMKGSEVGKWDIKYSPDVVENNMSGIAMITEGAFSTIMMNDLLDNSWKDAMNDTNDRRRWEKLMEVISNSSVNPISLDGLKDRETNSVYTTNDPNSAQEFFLIQYK